MSKSIAGSLIVAMLLMVIAPAGVAQEIKQEQIQIMGAVALPGDYPYTPGMDVKQALEMAGGVTSNADKSGAVLVRANREVVPLNLQEIMDGKKSIILQPGDAIAIKPGTVTVTGQVRKPASIELKPDMTAGDALAAVGGPTPVADLAGAYITRDGNTISARLDEPSSSAPLMPNDVITLPELNASITGAVAQPGTYPIVPGMSDNLHSLLDKAGGLTANADMKSVRITPTRGMIRPVTTVDASHEGVLQTIQLRGGDAVFIPQIAKKQKRSIKLNDVYQVVLIVYTLIQIFR